MKQEFLDFVDALMKAAPEVAEQLMTENVKMYMEALSSNINDKPILTDNGKIILAFLQENGDQSWTAKSLSNQLGLSSRGISGAMRKLCNDGFVEKIGKDPTVYVLSNKGKEISIN